MLALALICAALAVGYLLYQRMRTGAAQAGSMIDAPAEVCAAAKRLGFIPATGASPIASLHSAELCIAAMASAFAQMDAHSTADAEVCASAFVKYLALKEPEAHDATVLGPWLVTQGGGPTPAFERLARRLKQLDHGPYFDKLMRVLGDVAAAGTKGMPSAAQADAMGALARIFRTA